MGSLVLAAIIFLALAKLSSSQEADWLWQFMDDEEKDSPDLQKQILLGAQEISRMLLEREGQDEGEGEGGENIPPTPPTIADMQPTGPSPTTPTPPLHTPSAPTPLPSSLTQSPTTPAVTQPTSPPPTSPAPTAGYPTPSPQNPSTPTPATAQPTPSTLATSQPTPSQPTPTTPTSAIAQPTASPPKPPAPTAEPTPSPSNPTAPTLAPAQSTPSPPTLVACRTVLAEAANAGDKKIQVADVTGLAAGMSLTIADDTNSEIKIIVAVIEGSGRRLAAGSVTLDVALENSYAAGTHVTAESQHEQTTIDQDEMSAAAHGTSLALWVLSATQFAIVCSSMVIAQP